MAIRLELGALTYVLTGHVKDGVLSQGTGVKEKQHPEEAASAPKNNYCGMRQYATHSVPWVFP